MAPNLSGRNFLKLLDFTSGGDRQYLIDLAADLKAKKHRPTSPHPLPARARTSSFSSRRTSTRTRCSFEVARHGPGHGRHLP